MNTPNRPVELPAAHLPAAHLPAVHLTDAQFTGLLLGSIPAEVTRHLETCTACAGEARRVSSAIGSFAQQSRLWAERRAATQQRLTAPSRHPLLAWLQRPLGIAAWSAAAAALVLSASVSVHRIERSGSTASPTATAIASPSPARLQADNALLNAIDGELNADVTPPASSYGLQAGDSPPVHRVKRISN